MLIFQGDQGLDEFAAYVGLEANDLEQRRAMLKQSFMPFRVTEYYADLIRRQDEPYRGQLLNVVLPPLKPKPFQGRFDPYGNTGARQEEEVFLQHKYMRTLLLHIDNFCVANCQFCYKVNEIKHERTPALSFLRKVEHAVEYLRKHPEVDNVLVSGGDPASFRKTGDIIGLVEQLLSVPTVRFVRLATKGLAYHPERFLDDILLEAFKRLNTPRKRVLIISQFNHPAELTGLAKDAIEALRSVDVEIRGQPALIRGVNDSVETLVDLQRAFFTLGIISYYITVFMPVRGVEQYGLLLHEAFRLVTASKRELNGLEKKGVLLASHDFGKLEICGFLDSAEHPDRILLKWHQVGMPNLLPAELRAKVPTREGDVLNLEYDPISHYCVDHVFRANGLPYQNEEGNLNLQSAVSRVVQGAPFGFQETARGS